METIFSTGPNRNRLRQRLGVVSTPDRQPLNFSAFGGTNTANATFATALSRLSAFAANDPVLADDPFQAVRADRRRTDIWVETYIRRYWSDAAEADREGTLGVVSGGVDHVLNDRFLVGLMVQADWMRETVGATDTDFDGLGWIAGPYASIRLTEALYLDTRAAWGTSSNDQDASGVTGSFDTTRWVVAAELSGDWFQNDWRVTPSASVSYGQERLDGFTDSSGAAIASSTSVFGQAVIGPEFAYSYRTSTGALLEPYVALYGIWDFAGDDTVTVRSITDTLDILRAEVELGFTTQWSGGASLRASLAYDGLGTNDLDAVSGSFYVSLPLN